jgi:hypothetical protein
MGEPRPGIRRSDGRQRVRDRLPQIGGVDQDTQEETRRLDEAMACAAIEWLPPIVAVDPPCSVIFTVWAAMTAVEGWGWCPIDVRTAARR